MNAIKVAKVITSLVTLTATAAVADTTANTVIPRELAHTITRCAPQVAPNTILNLVRAESAFDPNLIGINADPHQTIQSKNATDATDAAQRFISQGKNIDLGLGQINSANLARLKLTVAQAFDPCLNVKAAAQLLTEAYLKARTTAANDQAALDAALSAYNTGTQSGGLVNGYVAQVRSTYTVPSIDGATSEGTSAAAQLAAVQVTAERPVPAPAWDVYGQAQQGSSVVEPAKTSSATPAATAVMVFGAAPQASAAGQDGGQ
ncbi:lytic transglycosylase domain-containing protein [Dyella sp. M7H15-1]|uniref:lytic transglycosylase domain-containing protein n=1 Tax=Dyella sp. M7H15-1 TaxID=2501295 RepID=UPI0013E8F181|nr:lytic transglycosylase domain-containing protein [Dyella sp. M7H15-1]